MNNPQPVSTRLNVAKKTTWQQRLRTGLAQQAAPASAAMQSDRAAETASTGIINLQVWLDQAMWRPAGFWAFCAGLLASGALRQAESLNWPALALLALLVDPLWGSIWRLAGGRAVLVALPQRAAAASRFTLPYMQEGSPAARLLTGDHTDVWPSALRVGAPAVLLALLVAALLGVYALALTLSIIVLAALGWTLRHSYGVNALLLHSIVAIGLPWVLTVEQAQRQAAVAWLPHLLLAGMWVVHQWGGLRNTTAPDWFGLGLMAAAQIGIGSLLIAVQSPLWLGPLALLLTPGWLLAYQRQPLRPMRFLWLASMLVSAAALGQTTGL